MSSNESRISNLEKEAMALGARIEESASDAAEELKTIRQDIKALKDDMLASFRQVESAMATKEDLDKLKNEMRADMRADMIALEGHLLDAMKQLLQQKE